MGLRLRCLVTLCLGGLVAGPAPAQEPAEPAPSGAVPAPTLHGRLALSLSEAIAMGIENNLGLETERHDPPIAFEDSRIAWGAYDPELFSDFGYASEDTPIASPFQTGAATHDRLVNGDAGFQGLIPPLGASYDVRYFGQSLESNSSVQSLSPEYRSGVLATLTFPLLKGLWWNEPWTRVKSTQIGYAASQEAFRLRLMELVLGIETLYWTLIGDQERLRVAEKSYEANVSLLERTNAQYEVGVVSKVEVTEAEAGVAERDFNRIVAENAYRKTQDDLINLVLGPNLTPISRLEIEPTDRPEDYVPFEVDVEEATRKAFANDPGLELARKDVEQRRIQLAFARNQRLPALNLTGTYGYAGLAGDTNPNRLTFRDLDNDGDVDQDDSRLLPPIEIARRYSATDDDFFSADGATQWSGLATFSIPIGNTAGRHGVSRAELEMRKSLSAARRVEQDLVVNVREQARNLRSTQQGIEAADRRRKAAAEQFRAENIRLDNGESTPFDVLQRERDLVDAESQRIGALQAYRVSVARLDRAQGTILKDNNIVIEDAARLR